MNKALHLHSTHCRRKVVRVDGCRTRRGTLAPEIRFCPVRGFSNKRTVSERLRFQLNVNKTHCD